MSYTDSADPIFTANVYAGGLLDALLLDAVVPFWQDLRDLPSYGFGLWIMRYARGGEHLKLRIHGAEGSGSEVERLLRPRIETWFEQIRLTQLQAERLENPKAPAIDVEDEAQPIFRDRTFVPTHYRRTHISFPAKPWLEDDRFIRLASRCLIASTGLFLEQLSSDGLLPNSKKQTLLAKSLIKALAASGLGRPDLMAAYVGFHRDWLLRFFIPETSKELETRARFNLQAQSSVATLRALQQLSDESEQNSTTNRSTWTTAVSEIVEYTSAFQHDQRYQIDPFTSQVSFPALFKVFHGMANQFGVTPLHEAYVHHLLHRVADLRSAHNLQEYATQPA